MTNTFDIIDVRTIYTGGTNGSETELSIAETEADVRVGRPLGGEASRPEQVPVGRIRKRRGGTPSRGKPNLFIWLHNFSLLPTNNYACSYLCVTTSAKWLSIRA